MRRYLTVGVALGALLLLTAGTYPRQPGVGAGGTLPVATPPGALLGANALGTAWEALTSTIVGGNLTLPGYAVATGAPFASGAANTTSYGGTGRRVEGTADAFEGLYSYGDPLLDYSWTTDGHGGSQYSATGDPTADFELLGVNADFSAGAFTAVRLFDIDIVPPAISTLDQAGTLHVDGTQHLQLDLDTGTLSFRGSMVAGAFGGATGNLVANYDVYAYGGDMWFSSAVTTGIHGTDAAGLVYNIDDDIAATAYAHEWMDDADSTPDHLGGLKGGGLLDVVPGSLTIADSGTGSPATSSSTPTSSYMAVTCSDADSCEWTLGETSVANGTVLTVTNVATNRLVLIHSANVVELTGASRQTLMGGASVTLWYDADRWTQTGSVQEVTDGIRTLTTGTHALLYTDKVLICDTSGGNITIDITPAAAFDQTRVVSVIKTVAGNSLILNPNGSENLNGTSTSTTITAALDGMSIKSDGTDLWGF